MKKRDYELVKNGKYNMRAIMQRAWAYVRNLTCSQYRNDFKGALKAAWVDARVAMKEYENSMIETPVRTGNGNVLKAFFAGNHPDYVNRDSYWR